MFCDLIKMPLRIEFRTKGDIDYQGLRMRPWYRCKTSFWGLALKTASAPGFTPSFWGHECRNQSNKKSLWRKSRFFRSDSISTIYPKSRFCTKRHKRLYFQGFWGIFEGFSRNVERENCKFEAQKCNFVFRGCIHKQFCSLGRGFFFDYSDVTIVFLNQSDVIVPSLIWHFLLLIRQYSITCSATLLKKFLYPLYSDTFLL